MILNQTTVETIRNANMDELNTIIALVRDRQRSIQVEVGANFHVGDSVSFNDKRGTRVTGTITKINRKSIKVDTGGYIWNVSPSLLNAA
jgi:hypothetical protein